MSTLWMFLIIAHVLIWAFCASVINIFNVDQWSSADISSKIVLFFTAELQLIAALVIVISKTIKDKKNK